MKPRAFYNETAPLPMPRRFAYYNENDPFAAAWLRELIGCGTISDGEVDERSIEDVLPADVAGFARCHFFAGVGVWDYALNRAGYDRWGITTWTGSCPCTPFSQAGKALGFDDVRHLWPAWFWLISQCRPRTIFSEQSDSKSGLAWLDLVSTDLAGAGYTGWASDLSAAGFGGPHRRQRLYIVANPSSVGLGRRRTGKAVHEPSTVERPSGCGNAGAVANSRRPPGRAEFLDEPREGLGRHPSTGNGSGIGERGGVGELANSLSERVRDSGPGSDERAPREDQGSGDQRQRVRSVAGNAGGKPISVADSDGERLRPDVGTLQAGQPDDARSGEPCGLANSQSRKRRNGKPEPSRQREVSTGGHGTSERLADAASGGPGIDEPGSRSGGHIDECERVESVGNAESPRLQERGNQPSDGGEELAPVERAGRDGGVGNAEHDRREGRNPERRGPDSALSPGPTNGFWRDAVWLLCRPEPGFPAGRYRAAERATESVLEQIPPELAGDLGLMRIASEDQEAVIYAPLIQNGKNRTGRLRGYGNALCAETAIAFIEAYLKAAK